MASASVLTAGVGYVFWWLAVRNFTPEAVGFAAAATSAMTLLGTLGVLGLGTLVIAELGRRPGSDWRLISLTMVAAALPGLVLGLAFAATVPLFAPELAVLASPLAMGMFAFGVALTSSAIVLDQAFVGLLRGGLQLWRNALFGVSRLVGLGLAAVALPAAGGLVICAVWVGANVVSLVPLAHLVAERPASAGLRLPTDWRAMGRRARDAVAHHALNVSLQFPGLSLPIAVTALLSATHTAYFYSAWMLAGGVFLASSALSMALYAVGVREPNALTRHARFTFVTGAGGGLLAMLTVLVSGDAILGLLFGASYPTQAGQTLRILVTAAVPLVVIDHYVALARIRGRPLAAARFVIPGGMLQIGLAVLGASMGGLAGLSLGWVVGVFLQAAMMLPLVLSVVAAPARTEVHA
jgi:O-antigen/teichoic acid export membrane protein